MTSQRYLNDKADSKDLVRSFISVIPYAIIALVILSLQHLLEVIQLVTSPDFKMAKNSTQIISYFGNEGFLYPDLIIKGMVMCGIIMALMLFRFMFSKKSVNVYFSLGITRTRLYVNRILAGVLALLLAVIIPLGTVLIINIANFGASAHLFEVFLYETSLLFMLGLAGFSIATVASTFSGSLVEAVFNTFAISIIPSIISTIFLHIKDAFLNGYVGSYYGASYLVEVVKGRAFSPWYMAVDLDVTTIKSTVNADSVYLYNPYSDMARQVTKTVPEKLALDFGLTLPLLIWLVISAVLIALGYLLINKRKAENSNSFGKFYISAAVLGTTAFLATGLLGIFIAEEIYNNPTFDSAGDNPFFHNLALILILFVIAAFIAFFVTELIVRRKLKAVIKTWPVFAALVLISIVTVTYFASGKFGTYNKLPAASEIESTALDIFDPAYNFPTHLVTSTPIMSDNADDIKLACEQFIKLRDNKDCDGRDVANVSFKFKLKNGEEILRQFSVYNADLFEEYVRAAYNSNYYKQNMKYLMLDKATAEQKKLVEDDGGMYYDDGFGNRVYMGDTMQTYPGMLADQNWFFASDDCLIDNYYATSVTPDGGGLNDEVTGVPFDDNEALMKALYNDLTKRSFDEVYMNSKRPVGVLSYSPTEADYIDNQYILTNDFGSYYYLMDYRYYSTDNGKFDSSKIRKNSAAMPSSTNFIYLYDDMTETIELLKAHGFYTDTHAAKIKEVYYTDSKLSADNALSQLQYELSKSDKNYSYWGTQYDPNGRNFETGMFFASNGTDIAYSDYYGYALSDKSGEKIFTKLELLNTVYDNTNHSLIKAQSPEKAQSILDKSVPFYCNYKDNGRYAYIIYEDNVIVCRYIPEANLEVLN